MERLPQLVIAARAGDRRAFEAIVDDIIDRMYAVARRVVGDPVAAQDAVQEAFITAWRDLRGLRDPERFEGWFYRLLMRQCYRVAARERQWSRQATLAGDAARDTAADATNFAERDAMERALSGLTPEHRAVVVLHHYADLPLTEVATILGIPDGTARSRLHHALRRLRPLVSREMDGPAE